MLRYDHEFRRFNESWKSTLLAYQSEGSTYGDFSFMGAIPGLPEVAHDQLDHGYRVLLRDPRGGYAECRLGPSEDFETITFHEGPDAFALESASDPLLDAATAATLAQEGQPGADLDPLVAALRGTWWGDESIDGGHRHYYVLAAPALLVLDTDDANRIKSHRSLSPAEGAALMRQRIADAG
ncbi:MAG: hypothetical protein KC609_23365 [Myxococcales bacterium]|nr:hypothetical protein [Myxococcales bacterium]